MGRLNFKTWVSMLTVGASVATFAVRANAASFNNRFAVQGYLKSGSSGLTGSYDMQIIIRKNGTAVWYKTYSGVSVSSGVFSKILSGNDDQGSPVPMAPDVFVHSANSDLYTVDVKVDVDLNGLGTGSDATFSGIDLVPVPMSLYSNRSGTIDQSGATTGQYLQWSGSAWAPVTLAVSSSNINSGAVGSSQLASAAVDLSTSTVTGILPVANGGTGISTAPSNGKLLIGNGTGYTSANLTQGSGVTITNSAGGITIAATGSGGTVTDVQSANADIGVATSTSTPVLTLNSGTGANQILKLNGSSQIPAVDGSLLTGVIAAGLSPATGTSITWPASSTGGIDMSTSSGTFKTGTGNVSLNGATTIATGGLTITAGNITMPSASSITTAAGALTVSATTNLTLQSASGSTTTVGNTGGASTTTVQSGTGGISVGVTGTTGNVTVAAGSTSGTFSGNKGYSGGVQNITCTGGACAVAGNGAGTIFLTINTANSTIGTITGCNSGVYAQGQKVTVIVVAGGGAFTATFTDTTVATATADALTLSAAANLVSGAANGVGRGVSLTLICATINGTKKWVEVSRSANTN